MFIQLQFHPTYEPSSGMKDSKRITFDKARRVRFHYDSHRDRYVLSVLGSDSVVKRFVFDEISDFFIEDLHEKKLYRDSHMKKDLK